MSDFMVRYIGHIDERKRPENFPREISNIGTYKPRDLDHLKTLINSELGAIIQNQGMIVQLDPMQVIEPDQINVDGRVYVPMHMITHIEAEVHRIVRMPQILENGTNVDGKANLEYLDPEGKKVLPS